MRNSIWLGMLCIVGAAGAMVSCGDSEETSGSNTTSSSASSGGPGGAGSGSTSSASSASSTSGTGGTGTGGGGGTGGGSNLLNGCDAATAEDHTADMMVTVNFGGPMLGSTYSPKCIRVKAGTDVTFAGSFMFHPLQGGTVVGMVAMPDITSPITSTTTGMSATFTLANPGDYGYYCDVHALLGMTGAIFVVP